MTRPWMHGTGWQGSVRRQSLITMPSHGPFTTSMVPNGSSNGGAAIGYRLLAKNTMGTLSIVMEFHCKIQSLERWSGRPSFPAGAVHKALFPLLLPRASLNDDSGNQHACDPDFRGCQSGLWELSKAGLGPTEGAQL
jgi:hypothetical protein